MKIAAITYLSHANVPCYPLQVVHESVAPFVDEYWFAVATEEDRQLTLGLPRDGVITGLPTIGEASDIGLAMNAAVAGVRDRSSADLFLLVQADTAAHGPALATWLSQAQHLPRTSAFHTTTTDAHLYHHWSWGWGYTLLGRDAKNVFTRDGVLEPRAIHIQPWGGPCCLHIGWLGMDGLIAHYERNAVLWKTTEYQDALCLRADREAFARFVLSRLAQRFRAPLAFLGSLLPAPYHALIERMGLQEEYAFVQAIAAQLDAEGT